MVLLDEAAHPVETHVEIVGALPAHVAREGAVGGRVVGFDRSRRMWVAYFDEVRAGGNILLAVEENRSSFGFRGGIHDGADGLTFGEYWSIRGRSGMYVGWSRIIA